MDIKLENKRLLACAEMLAAAQINAPRVAADIGTDHGYLACYLVGKGICQRAIAADINPAPLESAAKNVRLCGLENKIDLVLSDGLEKIDPDGVTDMICAGMGGELIARIISEYEWVKRCSLILQPMTKADELRTWLYDNGFYISDERACRDGKFVYAIMRAVYAPEKIDYPKDERYLAAGKITADTTDGAEYLRITADRLRRAGEGMLKSYDKRAEGERLIALAEKLIKAGE